MQRPSIFIDIFNSKVAYFCEFLADRKVTQTQIFISWKSWRIVAKEINIKRIQRLRNFFHKNVPTNGVKAIKLFDDILLYSSSDNTDFELPFTTY